MKVRIQRQENKIFIGIDTGLPIKEPIIWLSNERSGELDAAALTARIADVLSAMMTEVRRDEYARGWKDKAAKRAKATYFSGYMP